LRFFDIIFRYRYVFIIITVLLSVNCKIVHNCTIPIDFNEYSINIKFILTSSQSI